MKSKVNEIMEHVSKIENGSITLPELEYTVELARDLYEKLVVVRHKVYEEGILEQPTFDLSPLAFDSEETFESPVVAEKVEIEISEPVAIKNEVAYEAPLSFEAESSVILDETEDPVIELSLEEEDSENVEETLFEQPTSVQEEIRDFSDDLERPMPEIQNHESSVQNSVDSGSWNEKIKEIESHIPSSFTMSKLDTLIGSFGLNERLQFINELFGGSSEAFSDAIKILDARTGLDSAREKMAEFATSNNWGDADVETITDFVAKIKRRYA